MSLAIEQPTTEAGYFSGDPPVRYTKYIPYAPHVKQHAGLALDWVSEILFGGAAGGAKSDFVLMAALQYVDIPGYSAIIFRRTYTDLALPGAIMDRSLLWLQGTDAQWNGNDKQWVFPSGAKLNFAFLANEDQKFRYQSAEFQFVGFDELTQFTETQYLYLFSRLRGPDIEDESFQHLPPEIQRQREALSRVPLRMRAASNPGGRGHPWVKARFQLSGKGEAINTPTRIFIPSFLEDNPSLNKEAYEESLAKLDPFEAAQLRHGDWDARPPGDWFFEHDQLEAAVRLGHEYDELLRAGDFAPVDGVTRGGIDWGENTHGMAFFRIPTKTLKPSPRPFLAISPFNVALIEQLKWLEKEPEGEVLWHKDEGQHGADALVACIAPDAVKNASKTSVKANSIYVPPGEIHDYGQEPGEMARRLLTSWSRFGYPVEAAHYDAAGVQSMRTFVSTARSSGYPRLKSVKIPFGSKVRSTSKSYKAQTAGYMRRLLNNSLMEVMGG